jgi:hypothetical protein
MDFGYLTEGHWMHSGWRMDKELESVYVCILMIYNIKYSLSVFFDDAAYSNLLQLSWNY